jgi:hypothetical protein
MKLLKSFIFEATWDGDNFMKVWNDAVDSGKTLEDVAKHFNISTTNASQRAWQLRKIVGDDMKSFPRGRPKGGTRQKMSPEFEMEMIKAYNSSNNEPEAASKLSISPAALNRWANANRERLGLKIFKKGRPTNDSEKVRLSNETFIEIWNNSSDLEDVLSALKKKNIKISETAASVKASLLRRKGHDLKKMEVGRAAERAYEKKHAMEDYDVDLAAELEAALDEPVPDEEVVVADDEQDARAIARELFKKEKMKEKEQEDVPSELSPDELDWSS